MVDGVDVSGGRVMPPSLHDNYTLQKYLIDHVVCSVDSGGRTLSTMATQRPCFSDDTPCICGKKSP